MKEILEFIEDQAIDLSTMGVNNFALLKEDALKIIGKFKKENILLCGGDFITREDGELNYNYINWATDKDNIVHNLEYAKNFIEKYATDDTYIEFVTKVDLYKLFKEYSGLDCRS